MPRFGGERWCAATRRNHGFRLRLETNKFPVGNPTGVFTATPRPDAESIYSVAHYLDLPPAAYRPLGADEKPPPGLTSGVVVIIHHQPTGQILTLPHDKAAREAVDGYETPQLGRGTEGSALAGEGSRLGLVSGAIEPGETIQGAVTREIGEETGLDLSTQSPRFQVATKPFITRQHRVPESGGGGPVLVKFNTIVVLVELTAAALPDTNGVWQPAQRLKNKLEDLRLTLQVRPPHYRAFAQSPWMQ